MEKDVHYWLTINEQNTMILHPGAIGLPREESFRGKMYQQESSHDAGTGTGDEAFP